MQNLTISGGTFTSRVTRAAPTIPRDFRMIPLGDLDLIHEIRLANRTTGSVVARKRSGEKLYHVSLNGRTSKMTAAVYHGREGEEEWRRELQTYSGIRHPNIVQIYGAVNSSGLSATIFHDELLPLQQYYDLYKDSPLIYIYVKYWKNLEFGDALHYLLTHGLSVKYNYTPWIRKSTGHLAVDVMRSSEVRTFTSTLRLYSAYSDYGWHEVTPRSVSIGLGAFVHFPRDNPAQFVKLASVPNPRFYDGGWDDRRRRAVAMQNGWTRIEQFPVYTDF
ncbi:hypothetical protein B0H11DRAFT_2184208 [Mycena galericulata]|nr:hypothetical protein B0H11DRAFT_2184208 [Mycena galericulata]